MSSSDCIFCKIVSGRVPCNKIYEDEQVLAFLDVRPVSDGHTLVVPKAHFEKLHQCPQEVLSSISSCLGKIVQAVVAAAGAAGYNVLCNNGRAAGQLVDHVHFHIIPRNEGDNVFTHWPAYEYESGRADAIAEKICARL
ncbi:MAG: HIT family protein [Planctomycetota bacterium]|nr:MAG: HIT family protein [Planctomycetota bacterium]